MASPITWRTVSGPNNAAGLRSLRQAGQDLGNAISGFGDDIKEGAEDYSQQETDEFISDLNNAPDDAARQQMIKEASAAFLDMNRVNEAQRDAEMHDQARTKFEWAGQNQENKVALDKLGIAAKEFDVETQGEVHDSLMDYRGAATNQTRQSTRQKAYTHNRQVEKDKKIDAANVQADLLRSQSNAQRSPEESRTYVRDLQELSNNPNLTGRRKEIAQQQLNQAISNYTREDVAFDFNLLGEFTNAQGAYRKAQLTDGPNAAMQASGSVGALNADVKRFKSLAKEDGIILTDSQAMNQYIKTLSKVNPQAALFAQATVTKGAGALAVKNAANEASVQKEINEISADVKTDAEVIEATSKYAKGLASPVEDATTHVIGLLGKDPDPEDVNKTKQDIARTAQMMSAVQSKLPPGVSGAALVLAARDGFYDHDWLSFNDEFAAMLPDNTVEDWEDFKEQEVLEQMSPYISRVLGTQDKASVAEFKQFEFEQRTAVLKDTIAKLDNRIKARKEGTSKKSGGSFGVHSASDFSGNVSVSQLETKMKEMKSKLSDLNKKYGNDAFSTK